MLLISFGGAGKEPRRAAEHPRLRAPRAPALGGRPWLALGATSSIAALWQTQSEEEQGRERANPSPWELFQALGRGGMEEVYFKSCGCSSQCWQRPSGGHRLWCWVVSWACNGLKVFVEKGLPARGGNEEFSFAQPIKCVENEIFFLWLHPFPHQPNNNVWVIYINLYLYLYIYIPMLYLDLHVPRCRYSTGIYIYTHIYIYI